MSFPKNNSSSPESHISDSEIASNAVKNETSRELKGFKALFDKIVKIEAQNDTHGENTASSSVTYYIQKLKRKLGVEGVTNVSDIKSMDDIADSLRYFEDENFPQLLHFIHNNSKEALSLFTDKINENTYKFNFYENNALNDQSSLRDYFGSEVLYIKKGPKTAIRTPNGYRIFDPIGSNESPKYLTIHSGEEVSVLKDITPSQKDRLQSHGLSDYTKPLSFATEQAVDTIRQQIQLYKATINSNIDNFDNSAVTDELTRLKESLDKINLADAINNPSFLAEKTTHINDLLERANQKIVKILDPKEGPQKWAIFIKSLNKNLELNNEYQSNQLNNNFEALKTTIGSKSGNLISYVTKTIKDNEPIDQDSVAKILGYSNINNIQEAKLGEVMRLLGERVSLLSGVKSLDFVASISLYQQDALQDLPKKFKAFGIISKTELWKEFATDYGLENMDDFLQKNPAEITAILRGFSAYFKAIKTRNGRTMTDKESSHLAQIEAIVYQFDQITQAREARENRFHEQIDATNQVLQRQQALSTAMENVSHLSGEGLQNFLQRVKQKNKERRRQERAKAEKAYGEENKDTPEAQAAIADAVEISMDMPNFTIDHFNDDGLPIFMVGEEGQAVVVDSEKNTMYADNIQAKGDMAKYIKFPIDPENVAGVQITGAIIEGSFWTSDYGLAKDTRSLGPKKVQNMFRQIYPFGSIQALSEDEVNGWKNLQLELRARGKGIQYFWQQMGVTYRDGGLIDEKGGDIRVKIKESINSARVGNFKFLDENADHLQDLKVGILGNEYGIKTDPYLEKLARYMTDHKDFTFNKFLRGKGIIGKEAQILNPKDKKKLKPKIEKAILNLSL